MTDNAKPRDDIPKAVRTELRQLGYDLSRSQVEDLAARCQLTAEQVQTILSVLDRVTPLIDKIEDNLNDLDGKTARVFIRAVKTGVDLGSVVGQMNQADGGIVKYFADGGVENHVAQIAPAGAMRVWAEPETGGEAYIPLAQTKRKQSLAIWAETGRHLDVPGFKDGGVVKSFASGGGFSGTVTAEMPRGIGDEIERGFERALTRSGMAIVPRRNLRTMIEGA